MKKLLATLLAAILLLACIPAMADAPAASMTHFPELGLDMDITAVTDKCVYTASVETEGVLNADPLIAVADVYYCAMSKQELADLNEKYKEASEEEKYELFDYFAHLNIDIGYILVTDMSDADIAELMEYDDVDLTDDYQVKEVATLNGYHYYYIAAPIEEYLARFDDLAAFGMTVTDEEAKKMKAAVQADIEMVGKAVEAAIQNAKQFKPYEGSNDLAGQVFQFETIDLDGNPVKSEDLFKDNKVTMVNVWGTWCPGCVGELAELAQIHTRLQEKGCGIVGLEYERGSALEDYKESAVALLAENKVAYPNALLPGDNPVLELVNGFPTSFFVDSEGKILTYAICGCFVNQYEPTVDKLLAGDAVEALPDNGAAANDEGKYNVYVYDREGKPLEGVVIQFCDDTTCSFQSTDANGLATFQVKEPKVYDVHVLQAPEGFRQDEQAYKTLEDFSDVSIFLDRAE